jgi:SAM-dependent methyltransferase
MENIGVFSTKAQQYARYRWDYAPAAIQRVFAAAGLAEQSVVADIGAGTGILTKHFAGRVRQVVAIEPNAEMRRLAAQALAGAPGCLVIAGRAEATALADRSVDLIAVAQAIHWFEPQPTLAEFRRILKPGGWLAILGNRGTDPQLAAALEPLFPAESDTHGLMMGKETPLAFYFGHDQSRQQDFAFTARQTWEQFLGSLSSASYAPDEGSRLYPAFASGVRQVFERFSRAGLVESQAVTYLCLGQPIEAAA